MSLTATIIGDSISHESLFGGLIAVLVAVCGVAGAVWARRRSWRESLIDPVTERLDQILTGGAERPDHGDIVSAVEALAADLRRLHGKVDAHRGPDLDDIRRLIHDEISRALRAIEWSDTWNTEAHNAILRRLGLTVPERDRHTPGAGIPVVPPVTDKDGDHGRR